MKKSYLILNIVLICLIVALDVCYATLGGLWLKALASLSFVALGAVNLFIMLKEKYEQKHFAIIMLVGLVFAMAGDIVLNIFFIGGAALFAVGHVFYFVSYCKLVTFKAKDLLWGALIFVPSVLFITLAPIFDFGGLLMELVCVVYAIIISLMVGKSISNLVQEKNLLNILLVVGSCLFFFSDLMLLLNVFADLPLIFDILCLATYYPAQAILAHSIIQTK